jgi:MFS family permease
MTEPTTTPPPPASRGRRIFPGWYVVGGSMVIHFAFSVVFFYGFSAFFEPISREFDWPRAVTAGAFSLRQVESGFTSPLSGLLVDRLGTRKVAVSGVAVGVAGLLGLGLMQEVWQFYACVMLVSMGSGAALNAFPVATINWFRRLRGRALGVMSSGPVLAGVFVPGIVLLIERQGWRSAFITLGVAVAALCFPAAMLIRHRPEPYGYHPDGDPPRQEAGGVRLPAGNFEGMGVGEAVRSRAFWIIAAVLGVHYMGPSAVFIVQVPYFEGVGFTPAAAASTIGVFTVLSAIGRLGTGVLLDRFDRRLVVAGLLACDLGGVLVLVNITEYWMVFPFALLFGIGFGGMLPARNVLVSEHFGARRFASIYGLLGSASVAFGVVAPLMVGWSFDLTASYRPAFLAVACCIAATIPLPLLLRPPANLNAKPA